MSHDDPKATAAALLARDATYVTRPWSGPGEPVPIVEAEDCVVRDAYGNELVDFTSGYFVNNAGHCNPKVMAAAQLQMTKVTQVSHRHLTPPMVDLAERLATAAPGTEGRKVFFTTGGSESTEFALKMARQYKKKTDIAYLDNAYHGMTLGALALCAAQKYRDSAGVPLGDYTYQIKNPYCYRCPHADDCATQCLDGTEEALDARPETAAIVAEAVQAVGGIIPPEAWWKRLEEIRTSRGLLLVLDEIQTGLGRTGKMLAGEHYGLDAEIITMGKGLSGGIGSLGAVVAKESVQRDFFGGTTPTSAANAVSAAAGVALFDVIRAENLADNAAAMGRYMTDAVWALKDPWVGDVRFKGLLGGVELVSDRTTKAVLSKDRMIAVKASMQADGILLTISGPHGNVLRLQPPLTVKPPHIDKMVAALGSALRKVRGQAGS